MTNSLLKQHSTNLRKIKEGWKEWGRDMLKNVDQWRGDKKRVLHFLHACVTTTIAKPYRTWGLVFWVVVANSLWKEWTQ